MKKMLSLLLCVLLILGIIAYAGVALAQNKPGYIPKTAAGNPEDFVRMTPQEQDEYLMTLGSEEEIQQALSLLSPEQLAALEEYRLSQPLPPGTDGQDPPAASETTQTPEEAPAASDETESPGADYAAMTPQELYEYLLTLESEEEVAAVLNALTPEQYAALEAYALSVAEPEEQPEEAASPAVNYTNAAPFKEPVDIPGPMMAGQFAAHTLDTPNKEDALMLDKTVSGADGRYTLTIEAYATGEVTITTGDPLPTDIILVLDVSGSMNANMTDNVKCIDALKTAVNNFIDTVVGKATLQMNHRIAVVTFASASSIISGNGEASGAFVGAYNNASGISTLKNIIGDIKAGGSQGADSGLNNAISIFDNAPATGTRNRVVIYLAGGTPNGVELDPAIEDAYTLKTSCGATVYSVGVFDGADPTIPITDPDAKDDNKYMHFVSSNYPDATSMGSHGTGGNDGYYLSASNSTALNDIFNSIATRIGGTTVTLDETAVVKDVISEYFTLPQGADISSICLYTSAVDTTTGIWQPRVNFNGSVNISADRKTINVSGFDFSGNYYAPIVTNGTITGYQGTKLIIEIPIEYIEGSCFGGRVPTNKPVAGIYDDEFLVEALPIPTVDIPVQYDFTALDQSIYLTQDAALDDLFQEAAGYVADGTNNAYVNIVYTVKTAGAVLLGTYTISPGEVDGVWDITDFVLEGLVANTTYTVGCTVSPSNGPMDPAVVTKSATVYVWKPEVTWRDSTIYLGETADYEDNIIPVTWKNSSASAPAPSGAAPALTYQYTPAAASFATDTYVSVAVNIGSVDITDYTSFVHQACSPVCGYDPALGQFMVHVKTCSLTVAKTGAADLTDTFIFTVTGGGLTLRVSVQGNGSQTITGLPVGAYTVTEDAGWSWRYTADHADVTLSAAHASDTVTISNDRTDDRWLSGDDHAVNTFPGAD